MADNRFKLQPAVKKETKNIIIYTCIGTVLSWVAFLVLHFFINENIPFDYTVFLGGIGGSIVAILNFFLMCVTVQLVSAEEDDKQAHSIMKQSYSKRMLLQILWLAVAILAPCFWWAAGLVPLLFPSLGIKIKGILDTRKYMKQEVEQKQDEH